MLNFIAEESGVANTIDPLAGSYFVEAQTDRLEQEAEAYFREIYVPFGPHTDAQWRHMAETSFRRLPSGRGRA